MRISLLHTVDSNQAVFDQAASTAGMAPGQLRHALRPDLRAAVEQAHGACGAIPDGLRNQIKDQVLALAAGADVVIVTCATLGPAASGIADCPVPIVRADVALAQTAAGAGTDIVVLCAAQSALQANRALFEHYAQPAGARVEVRLVPLAWDLFQRGETAACLDAVARAAQDAYDNGADVVALAHPWMAAAVSLVPGDTRPLDGASAALALAGRLAEG